MKLLHLSANPHVRDRVTSAELMRDVVIAMLPTAIYGVLQWGFHALLVVVLTTLMAVFTEFAYQKAMKQPVTVNDWSAAVTGMILALNCPPGILPTNISIRFMLASGVVFKIARGVAVAIPSAPALLKAVIFPAKEISRKQRAARAGFMKLAPNPP